MTADYGLWAGETKAEFPEDMGDVDMASEGASEYCPIWGGDMISLDVTPEDAEQLAAWLAAEEPEIFGAIQEIEIALRDNTPDLLEHGKSELESAVQHQLGDYAELTAQDRALLIDVLEEYQSEAEDLEDPAQLALVRAKAIADVRLMVDDDGGEELDEETSEDEEESEPEDDAE